MVSSSTEEKASLSLQNDQNTSLIYLSKTGGNTGDFLHLLLSGVASYGAPLLRSAVGVTVMLIDIPQLNPFHLLPFAVREFLRSLHLPTVLKFLIQRGFVRLELKDRHGEDLVFYPGIDAAQSVYQSGDFTCRYLNPFFSTIFQSSGRLLTLRISRENWEDLLQTPSTPKNESSNETLLDRSYYNRTKLASLIDDFGNWTAAETHLAEMLVQVFASKANVLPRGDQMKTMINNEQKEDEIFCNAWKRMMIDVKEEKNTRKKRQVEALKAAGQQLKEKPIKTSTSSSKSSNEEKPLPPLESESRTHREF